MILTDAAKRESMLADCLHLADGGPGWHPYVLDKAERAVKSSPEIHAGLVAAVGKHIGPEACVKANRALEYFRKVAA